MAGIAITKKAKARKAEWERVCNLSPEELNQEYQVRVDQAWDQAWDLVHQEDGWKRETKVKVKSPAATDAPSNGHTVVFSKQVQDLGRVFRVEADINMDPESFFKLMVTESNNFPAWNPTILESKILYNIDSNTDLAYYVTAEAVRGAIDSRDFINVRQWKTRGDTILSTGISVMHPDYPPLRKYVRGENRIGGGMAFKSVPDHPDRCRFIWIVNSDLKGLLPSKLVEEALPEVCVETLTNAKSRIAQTVVNGSKK